MQLDNKIGKKLKRLKILFRDCEARKGHRKYADYFDAVFDFKTKTLQGVSPKNKLRSLHEEKGRRGHKGPSVFRAILDLTYTKRSSRRNRQMMLSRWSRMFDYVEENAGLWKGRKKCSDFISGNGGPAGCAKKAAIADPKRRSK